MCPRMRPWGLGNRRLQVIVGVVEDVRHEGLDVPPEPPVYVSCAAAVHRVRRPHRVQARAGRPQDDSPGRRPTDGSDAAGAAPLRDESV
jgi:hypothetical protein